MRAVIYPNQRLLVILGTSMLRENDDGTIVKISDISKEELVNLYKKYFPQLPVDWVKIAIDKMKYKFK